MPNIVEVLIRTRIDRAGLKADEEEAKASGERAGRNFSDSFGKRLSGMGKNTGKGAGIFTAGAGALSMAGPLAAAGAAVGAFGAIAVPILTKIEAAHQKLTAAQQKYNQAVTSKQRQAALLAEQQATQGLSGSQKSLMGEVGQLSNMWHKLQDQMTPMVVSVTKVALALMKTLMPAFKVLATVGGNVLSTILGYLARFMSTPFFAQMIKEMGQLAQQVAPLLGQTLVGLLKVFGQLFMQAGPAGVQLLQVLLPLIVQLLTSLIPVVAVVASLTAKVLTFLTQTHLLIPLLGVLAVAFLALSASSGIGAVVIAITVLVAAIVWMSKNWREVWNGIKHVVDDAINFIKAHWRGILEILTGPIGFAIVFIVDHFNSIKAVVSNVVHAIGAIFSGVFNAIVGPIKSAVDFASGIIGGLIHLIGSVGSSAPKLNNTGAIGSIHGMKATGGIIGAAATGGARSGLTMVGEHGRELVSLPGGSKVHSNPDTERMMAGGSGGMSIVIELGDSFKRLGLTSEQLADLRYTIRKVGGRGSNSVQTALGQA